MHLDAHQYKMSRVTENALKCDVKCVSLYFSSKLLQFILRSPNVVFYLLLL